MSISAVSYSGQWLIPAPLISITKNYSVLGNQKKVGALYTFNVVGVISNDRGSPNSAGTFSTNGSDLTAENIDADDKLAILLRKQTAIRNLFANDGQKFQIRSPSNLSGIYLHHLLLGVACILTSGFFFFVLDSLALSLAALLAATVALQKIGRAHV